MQCVVIAVGKPLTNGLLEVADEYEKRLKSSISIDWLLLPASSQAAEFARTDESARIMTKLKSTDTVILLDERGKQYTNQSLADEFTRLAGMHGRLVVIIGGAFGVDDTVRSRAQVVWSFGQLVFPHQLIRVMLLEQLYRTQAVIQGHPYHHV